MRVSRQLSAAAEHCKGEASTRAESQSKGRSIAGQVFTAALCSCTLSNTQSYTRTAEDCTLSLVPLTVLPAVGALGSAVCL